MTSTSATEPPPSEPGSGPARVALVTGAAGGIGRAVVRQLAEQGTAVAAVDRDGDGLRDTVAELHRAGLAVTAYPADVTDADAVEALVDAVEEQTGPVEYLVNAAGLLHVGEVAATSPGDWAEMFAVNAGGVFLVSRAVVARMAPRGRGALVTVASNAAATPRARMAGYGASKAAATMFTKSLGLEVARFGIRCNVVAPGSTETPMLWSMWQDDDGRARTVRGNADEFRVGIPLGKTASPEDVAAAVLFLLSDRAGHITLHGLTVDGGAALGV
ncbi:2,3-dihydro-2,3-dihydroxybenzoate dehydrogenase [Streptomyces coelicoflavus]|uniref:2,3-dihydro-2,3-dihydroxybenzoate dehydrogenase n=1 Tax=Streptomyces TaxID=1883 RepID=UPI0024ACA5B3|nr:2,3-dihydro-2,3-dihydroxybenzoate dehydrogenase [Streptomyces coelicoflavus]MDI6518338.1 2,3-dihydro-2,3-dihydroxybenzoate dehydrogenase [Streptomyces coelicoflavus]